MQPKSSSSRPWFVLHSPRLALKEALPHTPSPLQPWPEQGNVSLLPTQEHRAVLVDEQDAEEGAPELEGRLLDL